MSLRSHIGFNSQVLHTARSDSCEHPWFFVLTLSGLEVGNLLHPANLVCEDAT